MLRTTHSTAPRLHSDVSYVEGEKSLTQTQGQLWKPMKWWAQRSHFTLTELDQWNETKPKQDHVLCGCVLVSILLIILTQFLDRIWACLKFWSRRGTPYEMVFGHQHRSKFRLDVFLFSSFKNPVILYLWCSLKLCLSVVCYCYCFGLSNGYHPSSGPTRAVIQHRKLISTRDSLWIFSYYLSVVTKIKAP